jgi:hypothetical protein
MAAPAPLTGHRVKFPPGTCTPCPCFPYSEANRSGHAERSGKAARPSAAEKTGSGVFPDYANTTRMYAEEDQVVRSGQAERIGNDQRGVGVSPYCDSANRSCAKEAKRSDHAERSGKRVPLHCSGDQCAAKAITH